MSLSKVYRGEEATDLKEFHFGSFDEGGAPVEKPFVAEPPAKAKAAPPAPAPEPKTPTHKQEIDEAYAKGRQEALDQAGKKLEQASRAFAAAVTEVDKLRGQLAERSRDDMLRLVMVIAEQVIRREVTLHPDIVVKTIEQALQASVRADHCKIHVNPADLEAVTAQKPLFLASISGLKNLSIEADPQVTAGGCRIASDLGEVDATLETQLAMIRQTLTEGMSESE